MSDSETAVARALPLIRKGRYDEAIVILTARVDECPGDLKSLLHLGFCYLLNRSEKVFLRIYHQASDLMRRLGQVPEDVRLLFQRYEARMKTLTASALVLSSVAVAACETRSLYDAPPYDEPTDTSPTEPEDAGDSDTTTQAQDDLVTAR